MTTKVSVPVTGQQVAAAIDALLDERDAFRDALVRVTRSDKLDEAQEIAIQALEPSRWNEPQKKPPVGCDRGTTICQNLPRDLGIGTYIDHTLPEGTLEVWQNGERIGRIVNIGK